MAQMKDPLPCEDTAVTPDHSSSTKSEIPQSPVTDYSRYSNSDLISRITSLEARLRQQTAEFAALAKTSQITNQSASSTQIDEHTTPNSSAKRSRNKTFDASRYSTRFIALKFSYLGARYNGFEHANGSAPPPKPTIEEVIWKALRKARLINPKLAEGTDDTFEVIWDPRTRAEVYGSRVVQNKPSTSEYANGKISTGRPTGGTKVRLDLNWDGCQYSKCGRTDRGVSAFGQVIGLKVRSNRPVTPITTDEYESTPPSVGEVDASRQLKHERGAQTQTTPGSEHPTWTELSYVSILNSILPSDIRVLAWCPDPPPDFDARFSCRERRYKYFFTNPAFCPTPGPKGMQFADGRRSEIREGWLDIQKMREAAKKLEGLHDFRNLCKIDPSKQMSSCERRITFTDIEEHNQLGTIFTQDNALIASDEDATRIRDSSGESASTGGPKLYSFAVHGSAFLWHQVRCMVAILFLVGQGLEDPDIVDKLLDIRETPCRPAYEMADDAPLVLWDCIFPKSASSSYVDEPLVDGMDWIYAGDAAMVPSLTTKNDSKFGLGGVVDELWTQWRSAKMNEVLTSSLLDLVIKQGDNSALARGGFRDPDQVVARSQKVFDGSGNAKAVGRYTPVMQKLKLDSLEVQNAKYLAGRSARKDLKKESANGSGEA